MMTSSSVIISTFSFIFLFFTQKPLTNYQKSDIIIMSKKYISCIHYTLKTDKKQGQLWGNLGAT
nr:MAG TPA: hypothetical protein [Caudoviricetes sp.]